VTRLALFLVAFAGTAARLHAAELARFSCERPRPWEAGVLRNVSLAAAAVDGTVLEPGESFSFNRALAPARGAFVPGTSFLGGREVKSSGGGVCQVSSGLFNAALLAGLEVEERNPHSLYDPAEAYVPAGQDAMVSSEGGSDFRFRNSTAAPLTIRATAEGGRLTVVLEGRQRHPRKRWIARSILEKDPMRELDKPSAGLAPGEKRLVRKGFDGIIVSSRLCAGGDGSDVDCRPLGVDHYARVDSEWRVGAPERKP
jgi:hypothetical protein